MKLFITLLLTTLVFASEVDLFRAGTGGYHSYRIPALIVSKDGTLLAFCEGRKDSTSDTGNIDLLLSRSRDNGKTWEPLTIVVDFGEDTAGNPAPVIDRKTGVIHLLLTRNPGAMTERQIQANAPGGTRTVWITRSTDNGKTWSTPEEITSSVKKPDWTWYATGPGNGIQLRSGRLVIPCDHNVGGTNARHSHVILSDDRGKTWRIGGVAEEKTNESAVVELADGSLLLNMRSYHGRNRRAIARSTDQGETWSPLTLDEALIEPVCQASLIRQKGNALLFSNPASVKRERMTVRFSRDGGNTWPASRLIFEGPSAYSSLTLLNGREAGLLYERGSISPYEEIVFTKFKIK